MKVLIACNAYRNLENLLRAGQQPAPEYIGAVNDIEFNTVRELVEFVINDQSNRRAYTRLPSLTGQEAQTIKSLTGIAVPGYSRIIDSYAVKHIFKNHGNALREAKRGQIAVTPLDIEQVEYILTNPDKIYYDGKNDIGRDVIVFEKLIKGRYVIIEEVRTKRKTLAVNSMRIIQK